METLPAESPVASGVTTDTGTQVTGAGAVGPVVTAESVDTAIPGASESAVTNGAQPAGDASKGWDRDGHWRYNARNVVAGKTPGASEDATEGDVP